MTKPDRAQLAIVAGAPHPAETQSQPQHAGVRPATNGKERLGMFIDAQGKPTDDPELGYYGRTARAQFEAAYQAALAENQPDAVVDVPHVCAQCKGVPPDGKEEPFRVGRNLVWLHPKCRRFYYPDGDPIPVPKHHCDHCDSVLGITKWWNWPGYPDGIWLHESAKGTGVPRILSSMRRRPTSPLRGSSRMLRPTCPADRYQTTREQRGAWAADRILRWELQDAGVPYQRLQREVDRIRQMAGC